MKLTFAFSTYIRIDHLENLVAAMCAEECSIPYEILAVNKNSKHNTPAILEYLAALSGATLRHITEAQQGIVPARDLSIEEALESDISVFIGDDETPQPWLLQTACRAFHFHETQETYLCKHPGFSHKLGWPNRYRMTYGTLLKSGYECYWKRALSIARAIFRHRMRIDRADAGMGPMLGDFISATMRKLAHPDNHTQVITEC